MSGGLGRERLRLDEIFSAHAQGVFRYLWSMTGDRAKAEELTQEAFYRALTGSRHFQGKSSVKTWLLAVARHTYLDELRRSRRREKALGRIRALPGPCPPTTEEIVVAREDWRAVRLALDLLPERQRTMLVLREGRGLSYAQIAEVTGSSLASVRKNISLARRSLRKVYAAGAGQGHRPEQGGVADGVRTGP